MDARTFYAMAGPTGWPGPPKAYSFSSLRELSGCARRWQLTHARYGDHDRLPEPPGEAAEAGTIVHEVLGRVLTALSQAGLPAQETAAFTAVIASVDLPGRVKKSVSEAQARVSGHPRAAGARLRLSPSQVLRAVMEQFQLTYPAVRSAGPAWAPVKKGGGKPGASLASKLAALGLLSEEYVRHPTLPLHGFIDLVHAGDEGTVIVDFKTGARHDDHRDQLELYALLWWRNTGQLPSELVVRYVGEATRWKVDPARLEQVESTLAAEISRLDQTLARHPAPPSLGPRCRRCPARPFCDDYWETPPEPPAAGLADVSLRVVSVASHAATGEGPRGEELTLLWEEAFPPASRPLPGERLRVLGAVREQPGVARLRATSEVFRRAE